MTLYLSSSLSSCLQLNLFFSFYCVFSTQNDRSICLSIPKYRYIKSEKNKFTFLFVFTILLFCNFFFSVVSDDDNEEDNEDEEILFCLEIDWQTKRERVKEEEKQLNFLSRNVTSCKFWVKKSVIKVTSSRNSMWWRIF